MHSLCAHTSSMYTYMFPCGCSHTNAGLKYWLSKKNVSGCIRVQVVTARSL